MKAIKRIIAVMLTTLLTITQIGVSVSALTYNERSSAMIQFFAEEDDIGTMTAEDLRLFGIYMSNYYKPFETKTTSDGGMGSVMDTAIAKIMGGDIPAGKQVEINTLKNKVISNCNQKSVALYAYGDYVPNASGGLQPAVITKLAMAYKDAAGSVAFKDESGNTLFGIYLNGYGKAGGAGRKRFAGKSDSPEAICSAMLTACILMANENGVSADTIVSCLNKDLYITPFGDIIAVDDFGSDKTGTIIVPGCMNPYTWSSNGKVVPLMNKNMIDRLKTIGGSDLANGLSLGGAVGKLKNNSPISVLAVTSNSSSSLVNCAKSNPNSDTDDPENGESTEVEDKGTGPEEFGVQHDLVIAFNQELLGSKITKVKEMFSGKEKIDTYDGKESTFVEAQDALSGVFCDLVYSEGAGELQEFFYFFTGTTVKDYKSEIVKVSIYYKSDGGTEGGSVKQASKVKSDCDTRDFYRRGTEWDKLFYSVGLSKGAASKYGAFSCVAPHEKVSEFPAPQVFYTYMLSGFNPNLPPVDADLISAIGDSVANADAELIEMQKDVLKSVKDLLADGTSDKKANLITSFLNSFVLKAHRTMLGIQSNNIATVSNAGMLYSGFTGHVTTPTLADFSFTQAIIDNYNKVYVILMGCVIGCLVIMLIIHLKTIRQCVVLFLIMAICLAIPQGLIDGAITLSNTISQSMYADRFNYWAMIQHQQELQELRDAGAATDGQSINIDRLMTENFSMVRSYYSDDSIQLKWMAAKKASTTGETDIFDSLFDTNTGDALVPGANVFKFLFSGYFKQESYSSDALATYVYRTYSSIAKAAKKSAMEIQGKGGSSAPSFDAATYEAVPELYALGSQPYGVSGAGDYKVSVDPQKMGYRTAFYGASEVTKAMDNRDIWQGFGASLSNAGDDPELDMYLLYSESPFYYFYNVFANTHSGNGTVTFDGSVSDYEVAEVKGWLSIMLGDDMYTVTDTSSPLYGMRKDFLDMEGLFTYVIPYMYGLNGVVIDFTEVRGTDYNNSPAPSGEEGEKTEALKANTPSNSYSVNDKDDIRKIWNIYCPWVDALYEATDLNERIRIVNSNFTVADPLNPLYYQNNIVTSSAPDLIGRPMVFGEADAYVKGVTEANMTNVELKISNVLDDTYIDMRYLANYAVFSDEVLLTAAAMMATFNFNQEFSDTSLFNSSVVMYPQGYELKTFSYDAFLRMILLNSTGQSVMAKTDIYTAVIENTSFWTGVILLVVDALAIYVLPSAKLIFVVVVFILSLLMLMSCFLQGIENAPKTVMQAVVFPMLTFLLISVLHAVATAMLMGEGLTELVGSKSTAIVTNDPTVTLLLLALINGTASVFYIKILIKLIKDGIQWVKSTSEAVIDMGKGLVETVGNKIATMPVAVANGGAGGGAGEVSGGAGGLISGLINRGRREGGSNATNLNNNSTSMPRAWKRRMDRFTRSLRQMQHSSNDVQTDPRRTNKPVKDDTVSEPHTSDTVNETSPTNPTTPTNSTPVPNAPRSDGSALDTAANTSAETTSEASNTEVTTETTEATNNSSTPIKDAASDLVHYGTGADVTNKVGKALSKAGSYVHRGTYAMGVPGRVAGALAGGALHLAGGAVKLGALTGHLGAWAVKHPVKGAIKFTAPKVAGAAKTVGNLKVTRAIGRNIAGAGVIAGGAVASAATVAGSKVASVATAAGSKVASAATIVGTTVRDKTKAGVDKINNSALGQKFDNWATPTEIYLKKKVRGAGRAIATTGTNIALKTKTFVQELPEAMNETVDKAYNSSAASAYDLEQEMKEYKQLQRELGEAEAQASIEQSETAKTSSLKAEMRDAEFERREKVEYMQAVNRDMRMKIQNIKAMKTPVSSAVSQTVRTKKGTMKTKKKLT